MPAYKYQCVDCNEIEVMKFALNEVHVAPLCPKCDKPMIRQFGVGAVKFVGLGWAKNDS
jgi:putative FmdB family regulatory protein